MNDGPVLVGWALIVTPLSVSVLNRSVPLANDGIWVEK